jgi:hypothetical protein
MGDSVPESSRAQQRLNNSTTSLSCFIVSLKYPDNDHRGIGGNEIDAQTIYEFVFENNDNQENPLLSFIKKCIHTNQIAVFDGDINNKYLTKK